jgi:glutamate--cysteine ligase
MPAPTRQLSVADAFRLIEASAVGPIGVAAGDRTLGVELEWLVMDPTDPAARVPLTAVDDELVTRSLPAQSRVTFEPGGQLEVSSRPETSVGRVCAAAADDVEALTRRLRRRGIALVGLGIDPLRTPERAVRSPRYDAMEAYFESYGPDGRRMMCSTAAVQVNVALGDAGRWERAHLAGPVLAAAFANSPIANGRPSGWRSARLATWLAMDPGRTAPVPGTDAGPAWARYALAAPVMLIRRGPDQYSPVRRSGRGPFSLARWITDGSPWGWPTDDDIAYHLTTLFPPIRPRGWLEVRMIDALPDPWWQAAVAVTAAAVDERIAGEVSGACRPAAGLWSEAARHGLSHPVLAAAAQRVVRAARAVLPDLGATSEVLGVVDEFTERYVAAGRSPADDRLDDWAGTGSCIPPERPPRERTWI